MTSPEIRPIGVCVQCKSTAEEFFEPSVIPLVLQEADKFLRAKVSFERYLLVLNRPDKDRAIADALHGHLAGRQDAHRFEVWDLGRVLEEVERAMTEAVRARIAAFSAEWRDKLVGRFAPSGGWVRRVPARTMRLLVDRDGDPETVDARDLANADPAALLLDPAQPRITVLTGHFGAGKTSTALLAALDPTRTVLYVPAAAMDGQFARHGTNGFGKEIGRVLGVAPASGEPDKVFLYFLGRMVTRLLSTAADTVLIVDGLDENRFMRGLDGLKLIRFQLKTFGCRVILSTRTAHLSIRGGDFSRAFEGRRPSRRDRGLQVVELLLWTDQTSMDHVATVAQTGTTRRRRRLEVLLRHMRAGTAVEHYGTLLRHPIFLYLIIDDVAEGGMQSADRAGLVRRWILRKLQRDQRKYDGAPLGGDATEEARLVFGVLEEFAFEMCEPEDLTPKESAAYETLLQLTAARGLDQEATFELLLKSVLVTVGQRTMKTDTRVMFSHRIFHDFLLASGLHARGRAPPEGASQEIKGFYEDLSRGRKPAPSSLGTPA